MFMNAVVLETAISTIYSATYYYSLHVQYAVLVHSCPKFCDLIGHLGVTDSNINLLVHDVFSGLCLHHASHTDMQYSVSCCVDFWY